MSGVVVGCMDDDNGLVLLWVVVDLVLVMGLVVLLYGGGFDVKGWLVDVMYDLFGGELFG